MDMSQESRWVCLLSKAAQQLDGGIRSFPTTKEPDFLPKYAYAARNECYQRLFWKAAKPIADQGMRPNNHSAGWLVPDDPTECKPVFVANSALSAIWLLRQTLPKDTLPDVAWGNLAHAAYRLAHGTEDDAEDDEIPPSAQRPRSSCSPSTKRPAADGANSQAPSAKRARTAEREESDGSSPVSPLEQEPSQPNEEADIPSEGDPTLLTTVTNNNRRAEKNREEKRKAQALKKKQSLGLVRPREGAHRAEQAAYNSISPDDEHTIAWIIKQPIKQRSTISTFYDTAHSPYTTATVMLHNARAVGNEVAQDHAASFLKSWRSSATPFPTSAAPLSSLGTSQPNTISNAFSCAWSTVSHYEDRLASVHIQYRWAMAFLARAYLRRIEQLEQEDEAAGRGGSRSRDGKGNLRTEVKKAFRALVYPKPTEREKNIFDKRLQRAQRWYAAANELGWGSLCIMPYDHVSNTWVEQTLRVGEWQVWLELVKKVNPDAYSASKAFDAWLGSESIAGSIEGKERLCIEDEPPATTCEIEEVQDSEDEDFAATQSQRVASSSDPPRPLRQLTLPELFKPQQ
jgi:hypothetical protein